MFLRFVVGAGSERHRMLTAVIATARKWKNLQDVSLIELVQTDDRFEAAASQATDIGTPARATPPWSRRCCGPKRRRTAALGSLCAYRKSVQPFVRHAPTRRE